MRQPWSGEVVAVTEFYEVAPDLARDLRQAAVRSYNDLMALVDQATAKQVAVAVVVVYYENAP